MLWILASQKLGGYESFIFLVKADDRCLSKYPDLEYI